MRIPDNGRCIIFWLPKVELISCNQNFSKGFDMKKQKALHVCLVPIRYLQRIRKAEASENRENSNESKDELAKRLSRWFYEIAFGLLLVLAGVGLLEFGDKMKEKYRENKDVKRDEAFVESMKEAVGKQLPYFFFISKENNKSYAGESIDNGGEALKNEYLRRINAIEEASAKLKGRHGTVEDPPWQRKYFQEDHTRYIFFQLFQFIAMVSVACGVLKIVKGTVIKEVKEVQELFKGGSDTAKVAASVIYIGALAGTLYLTAPATVRTPGGITKTGNENGIEKLLEALSDGNSQIRALAQAVSDVDRSLKCVTTDTSLKNAKQASDCDGTSLRTELGVHSLTNIQQYSSRIKDEIVGQRKASADQTSELAFSLLGQRSLISGVIDQVETGNKHVQENLPTKKDILATTSGGSKSSLEGRITTAIDKELNATTDLAAYQLSLRWQSVLDESIERFPLAQFNDMEKIKSFHQSLNYFETHRKQTGMLQDFIERFNRKRVEKCRFWILSLDPLEPPCPEVIDKSIPIATSGFKKLGSP